MVCDAALVRIIGAPGTGRSSSAIALASTALDLNPHRQVLLFDTLGHGFGATIADSRLCGRALFRTETRANDILGMARHLIVTGAIGCVIVDDVPGLDVGAEQERLGRAKALATFSQCLGSVATAHDCRVILIDRAGGFRHERAPLGYRDYFAPLAAA